MNHKSINLKNNYILILLGLFFCLSTLQASVLDHDSLLYIIEQHQDDSIAAQALIDFAGDIIDDFPDSAFLYLEDAEEIAVDINSTYLLAVIHEKEGVIFDKMNEYADALEQFFQAKKDIESDHDFKQDSASRMIYLQVLNQLGVLYFKIDKFDESIEYLKSVILFMQVNGMEPNNKTCRKKYVRTYINLGAVNIRQRKFSEAEINYTKAITLLDDSDLISYSVILNNLGIIAKEQEEYVKAFDYHRRSLKIREEDQNYHGMAQSYNNIGATYFVSGDIESARINFEKSLEISRERNYLTSAIISLDYLKGIQEDRNNYKKAYEYQSQFQAIKDSLMNQEKLRAINQLEMQDKFDTRVRESQHRQEKIEAEQRRKETIYLLITAASVLGILILVLIYFLQRSKMKRQMLETRKNNLEVKGLELENINLERELEFRTKELTTNVMYMARTSEFITRISEKLLKSKMYFTQDNQEVINKVVTELQSYIDQDTWAEFEIRFQQVHNDFYTKLNELHPDLTANEKKLCAFLRLNMTTKEISAITYQSVNSIVVARSRLRKKLGIDQDENLISYLENL